MKRLPVFPCVLVVLLLWSLPVFAGENAMVTGDGVRIREAPGTTAKIMTSVNKGVRIEVTAKTSVTETIDGRPDFWYSVLYQDKKGYIFGRFLALDPGVSITVEGAAEGAPGPQTPTGAKMTIRPEEIIGDWIKYGPVPPVIYTFNPEGYAQYLSLQWNMDVSGERVTRKYLTIDLVRGQYTIEGSTVRVTWSWGETPESVFTVIKDKDGTTLVIDGEKIPPHLHTAVPGKTAIGDIMNNTEPDL